MLSLSNPWRSRELVHPEFIEESKSGTLSLSKGRKGQRFSELLNRLMLRQAQHARKQAQHARKQAQHARKQAQGARN